MSFPTVSLGRVAKIVNGGTPDTKVAAYWDGGIAWLTPKDMGKSTDPVTRHTSRTISQIGLGNSSARLVPPGSVILSTRAPIGHLALNDIEMAFNQGCRGLVPSEDLDAKFLYYFLKANTGLLNDLGTGTTFKELSAGSLAKVQVPLPRLAEQQRVVAALDGAFDAIGGAVRATQQAHSDVIALRKLHLSNSFREAVSTFGSVPLSSLCTFENGDRGENYPNKSARTVSGVPFINAGHLSERRIDMSSMDYIAPERFDLLRSGKPQEGDVLFCLRGSLGKHGIVRGIGPCAIASSLVIVRPRSGTNSDYVAAYFGSDLCEEMIDSHRSGTAQPNLGAKQLATFAIPPLDPEGQARFVESAKAIASECGKAIEHYDQKIALLAELKQSILTRAFSGELTREPLAA